MQVVPLLRGPHWAGRELSVRQGADLLPGLAEVHQGVHHHPGPRGGRERSPHPRPGAGLLWGRLRSVPELLRGDCPVQYVREVKAKGGRRHYYVLNTICCL